MSDHYTPLNTYNGIPCQSRIQSPYHGPKALGDLTCCCLFDLIFQLIVWRLKVSTELDREEKRQRVYMGEGSMLRRHLSGWAKCLRSRKTLWKVGTWCFWQGQALFGARWNSWVSWIHTRNWVKIKSHSGYQTCRGYRETHLGHFKTPLRVLYKCSFIYST